MELAWLPTRPEPSRVIREEEGKGDRKLALVLLTTAVLLLLLLIAAGWFLIGRSDTPAPDLPGRAATLAAPRPPGPD